LLNSLERQHNESTGRKPACQCADITKEGDMNYSFGFLRAMATLLGLCIQVIACGGGGGGPTEPEFPNVAGRYSGNWIVTARDVASGETITFTCSGSFTVSSQTDANFSGTFLILSSDECDAVAGTIAGTITRDGSTTITIEVPGGDPNPFSDLTGCAFISGDSSFSGSISNSQMSLTVMVVTDCLLDGEVIRIAWTVRFEGAR
jgi:hypothetical protein